MSDVPGFVFLAILLAVPSVVIGIATVKASVLVNSSQNLNNLGLTQLEEANNADSTNML